MWEVTISSASNRAGESLDTSDEIRARQLYSDWVARYNASATITLYTDGPTLVDQSRGQGTETFDV